MKIKRWRASGILRSFIRCTTLVVSEANQESLVLPVPGIVLAIPLEGELKCRWQKSEIPLHGPSIVGVRRQPLHVWYAEKTSALFVESTECGASRFVDLPVDELAENLVPLNEAIRRNADIVTERLSRSVDGRAIAVLAGDLLRSSGRSTERDPIVEDAVQAIRSARGNIRIRDLVARYPLSRDPFEKRFRRVVGTSPKHLATIIRMSSLIDRYPLHARLTDVALEAGFFDQAHFAGAFTRFAGMTPSAYFALRSPHSQ
jgi:AraC-like DNA-binding protein